MLSPIVEACPTKNKEAVMSSLHSFTAGDMWSGTDQYPVFCSIRDRILVDFGLYLGSYSLF